MKAYSMDFRRAVAKAYDECGSSDEVAADFGCSASWVRRLVQRRRETGGLEPKPARRPDNTRLGEPDLERLRGLIAATPDLTLAELAAALGGKAGVTTVWRATRRLKLTLKKRACAPPSRTGPTSRRRARLGSTGSRA